MVLGGSVNYGFVALINVSRAVFIFIGLCQASGIITKQPKSGHAIEGSTLTLSCEFSRPLQFRDENIVWYKNHKALSTNDVVISEEDNRRFISVIVSKNNKRFDLKIKQVSSNDTGVYFCYFTLSDESIAQSINAFITIDPAPETTTDFPSTFFTDSRKTDVINKTHPTAVFVSISTTCIALVLLVIIVLWLFKGKKTYDNNRYINDLIMPSSCLKRTHNDDDAEDDVPSTRAFEDDVFVNKNAAGLFFISGRPPTTTTIDNRVQNDYHDISTIVPPAKDISKQLSHGSNPVKKERKHRNVEGLTYAQLDLKTNNKASIRRGMPRTNYAVIELQ